MNGGETVDNNIYDFKDLTPDKKQELLNYIGSNFSKTKIFNTKHSAYGLKQPFTRLFGDKDVHVTSKCFMEAMLAAGFQAKLIPNASEPNWYFNVRVLKPKS
jgi:hypothetical protein